MLHFGNKKDENDLNIVFLSLKFVFNSCHLDIRIMANTQARTGEGKNEGQEEAKRHRNATVYAAVAHQFRRIVRWRRKFRPTSSKLEPPESMSPSESESTFESESASANHAYGIPSTRLDLSSNPIFRPAKWLRKSDSTMFRSESTKSDLCRPNPDSEPEPSSKSAIS